LSRRPRGKESSVKSRRIGEEPACLNVSGRRDSIPVPYRYVQAEKRSRPRGPKLCRRFENKSLIFEKRPKPKEAVCRMMWESSIAARHGEKAASCVVGMNPTSMPHRGDERRSRRGSPRPHRGQRAHGGRANGCIAKSLRSLRAFVRTSERRAGECVAGSWTDRCATTGQRHRESGARKLSMWREATSKAGASPTERLAHRQVKLSGKG